MFHKDTKFFPHYQLINDLLIYAVNKNIWIYELFFVSLQL
jgi:hypothetical protein